jgi:hypothetical protein
VASEPSSLEGSVVGALRRSPARALKLAIAMGGLLAVLVAFSVLTLAKLAARSAGVLPPPEPAPLYSAEPSVALPSTAVTAPGAAASSRAVPLDAGRARP